MSSSHSQNRPSTSSEPATVRPRSHLSTSKSPDSPTTSDYEAPRPPTHRSCADPDDPHAPTSSARWKADDDSNGVSAAVRLPFRLSLTLQNKGSVARDHLASERTFLAYVRTSLSFASAGVGTVLFSSLFPFNTSNLFFVHVALVQLFRVSVSASANGSNSSLDEVAVAPYARPLGATLIAFGLAVLVMGEYDTRFPLNSKLCHRIPADALACGFPSP
jgi:uncharacterized membrane protein YidH (DUF202 family)